MPEAQIEKQKWLPGASSDFFEIEIKSHESAALCEEIKEQKKRHQSPAQAWLKRHDRIISSRSEESARVATTAVVRFGFISFDCLGKRQQESLI